jgi:hypothetical protein
MDPTNNKDRKTSDYAFNISIVTFAAVPLFLLLLLILAGVTIAIRSIITIVQFQYALAANADQFSPGYKIPQSVPRRSNQSWSKRVFAKSCGEYRRGTQT